MKSLEHWKASATVTLQCSCCHEDIFLQEEFVVSPRSSRELHYQSEKRSAPTAERKSHNRRPASMFHVVRGSLGFWLRPLPAETDISARICSTSPLQSLSGSSRFSFGFELCSIFVHTQKRMPERWCHAMFGLPLISTTLVQMTFQTGLIERFSLKLNKCANSKKGTHLCECCCRSLWSEPPGL